MRTLVVYENPEYRDSDPFNILIVFDSLRSFMKWCQAVILQLLCSGYTNADKKKKNQPQSKHK